MAPRSLVGAIPGFSAFATFRNLIDPDYAGIVAARSVAPLNIGLARRRFDLSCLPGLVDCAIHTAVSGGGQVSDQCGWSTNDPDHNCQRPDAKSQCKGSD